MGVTGSLMGAWCRIPRAHGRFDSDQYTTQCIQRYQTGVFRRVRNCCLSRSVACQTRIGIIDHGYSEVSIVWVFERRVGVAEVSSASTTPASNTVLRPSRLRNPRMANEEWMFDSDASIE
ncbi:hypothetical protein CEXT_642261 [Caerostris extrusa]|uniref:Uncharacterized protein n=1 Tax=Caerostris extrusa TaxID=172846 RepID=A0AAV4WFY4_CAEEX|nr:hypothetical protein CEXT_642261 [Caerostris extrusa]